MKEYTAEVATEHAYQLAEGPVWDDELNRVLWVDIPAGNVHIGQVEDRVIPASAHHVDELVGAVIPGPAGKLLVAGHQSVYVLSSSEELSEIVRLIPRGQQRRLNDAACDSAGRLFVGSLSLGEAPGAESLWQVDSHGGVRVVDDDLVLSNGIAWSPDQSQLYNVDTGQGVIWSRPYDVATGRWGPRREAFHVSDGSPDGICVDTEGRIWTAIWGRGEVRCYTSRGDQVARIKTPAPHTSSVAFVGPALDRLLITTAKDDLTPQQQAEHPASGHLFLADVDATGLVTGRWI